MRMRLVSVASVVLAVGLAGASAPGQVVGQAGAERPAPPRESLRAALDLSQSDLAILDTFERPPARFVERAGVKEFSGQMLVKVRDAGAFLAAARARVGGAELEAARARVERARARLAPSLVEAYPDVDEHAVRLPEGWGEDAYAAYLMATGDYEYVEPNWLVYPVLDPNDPQLNQQIHHNVMHTRDAWDHTTGDPTIAVGICDTGVDNDHPDLQGALLPGFNSVTNLAQVDGGVVEDGNGHGTAVSGAAAAIGNNGVGVVGMGWNFKIIPVKVSQNPDGTAFIGDLTQGARWASENGARVVSVSFGGVETQTVATTGSHIKGENHLLCWAAGNEGSPLGSFDWEDVIVVGASSNIDTIAGFSNFGEAIDIVAPGINIRTTTIGGGYGNTSGTSLSTPLINGLLALIWSVDPSMSADEVEQAMYDQAIDLGDPGEDDDFGAGRADAGASVLYVATGAGPRPLPFSDDFEDTLDPNDWTTISGASVSGDGVNEPSGESSMSLGASGEVVSEIMKARQGMAVDLYVSFFAQQRGIPAGGELIVETRDLVGVWRNVATIVSDGEDDEAFGRWIAPLHPLAAWDEMQLRIRATGGEGAGSWYVDDVRVGEGDTSGLSVPFMDNYEGVLDEIFFYASNTGAAISAGAANEPSGSQSLAMGSGDVIETSPILIQDLSGTTQYVRAWAQPQGVPQDASLFLEYKSVIGVWNVLAQMTSDGTDPAQFELMQAELPALGFWDGLQVRLRRTGAPGTWYADDLYVGPDEAVIDEGCNAADIAEPYDILNFDDVVAFLNAFGAMEASADLATPFGVWNFDDVVAFLGAFGAGCP